MHGIKSEVETEQIENRNPHAAVNDEIAKPPVDKGGKAGKALFSLDERLSKKGLRQGLGAVRHPSRPCIAAAPLGACEGSPALGYHARMCSLYSLRPSQDEIRRAFAVVIDAAGNLPALPGIFPNTAAPVIHLHAGERTLAMMRWGMPSPAFALSLVILDAVREGVSIAAAENPIKLKTGALAEAAEQRLQGRRWLLPLLRAPETATAAELAEAA